jgi:drug/metabolite transporter (DMT)-like permease
MTKNTKAHLAGLGANFIFGINYAIIKYVTPSYIQPLAVNVVRVLVSISLFWSLFLMKPGTAAGIQKKDILRFILCGLTGIALNQVCLIKGLSMTSSFHGAMLSLGTPIFISIFAVWLLKEKMNATRLAGLACGIGGATILIMIRDAGSNTNNIVGDLLALTAAIAYAFYLVLARPLMQSYSALHVTRWVLTIGAIAILPIGWGPFIHTDWQAFHASHWLALGFVAVAGTFLGYLLSVYALSIIGPSATGSYIYTQPVFAAIVSTLFLGDHFTLIKAAATALIFAGVYLVNRKRT